MAHFNTAQLFHSGKRLQKIRELQGITFSELAKELSIEASLVEKWENEGVPEEFIEKFRTYFEVSASLFLLPLKSQSELEQLASKELFQQQDTSSLQARLHLNKKNKTPTLDLSGLGLSEVPVEVFEFSWLTELNIRDNQFKQLPCGIVLLQQLERLDISNNLLPQLPAIICALVNLEELHFQNNPLSLQAELLDSSMKLDAYQTFLRNVNVTVAVVEQLTTESLQCLDGVRDIIEQTQPLILVKEFNCEVLTAQYKHITNMVYIAEQYEPGILAASIKSLLPKLKQPLLIHLCSTITDSQYSAISERLTALYPESPFLLKLAKSKEEFSGIFNDIQTRRVRQNNLSSVKFEHLALKNIGVFENIKIVFDPEVTVFIGLNGAGKTTLLKVLALSILGPELAEFDNDTAADLLRITGKSENQACWQSEGSISLQASVNGKSYKNTIRLSYNSNSEKVEISGDGFEQLFNADGYLINLMLGIGEQRNTVLKKTHRTGLGTSQPKARDLLPIIRGDEQSCIAYFTSWLGNLALSVSQGEIDKQQEINVSFAIFSMLMQEPIQFSGLTKVDPLELWVEHQNPKQIIPLRLVSQGYQAVMGWVGYIIQRMFEAYADALQPLQQPAIIIIDEIDQLLHVKWQQKIINVLAKEFFPNTQWIVTTHSPMVVTGLDQGQVIQLHKRDNKLVADPNSVDLWLWQYGDIMRCLFEVSPVKPCLQEKQLKQDIEAIMISPKDERTTGQQQELEKLKQRLEKVRKSRAFVDEIYAEQQKLHDKEQELSALIKQLSGQVKA